MSKLNKYYDALTRLKKGKPKNVPINSKINLRNVALEAKCDPSAIKKSRPSFKPLILAIEDASKQQNLKVSENKRKITNYREQMNLFKKRYEDSLNRELMLIQKIDELENNSKGLYQNDTEQLH